MNNRLLKTFALLLSMVPFAASASTMTFVAGIDDSFEGGPDAASPSPELVAAVGGQIQDFDLIPNVNGGATNRQVVHTFTGIPRSHVLGARLEMRVFAGDSRYVRTDGVFLSTITEFDVDYADEIFFRRSFGAMTARPPFYPNDDEGLVGSWASGDEAFISINLANAPTGNGEFVNLLTHLMRAGRLDVDVSDDTGVDFMRLVLTVRRPQEFQFREAYLPEISASPNPFRTRTAIDFTLSQPTVGSVRILDVTGRVIRTLENGSLNAGNHSVSWDGRNERGDLVASGVYFYRFESPQASRTERIIRVK